MFMVPASNLWGNSFQVECSRWTSRIISPPPRNGSMASRISGRPHSTPTPVGPSILCPLHAKKSQSKEATSTGMWGALCAPSTNISASSLCASSASLSTGLTVASTFEEWMQPTILVLGPIRRLVAFAQVLAPPGVGDKVYGFGRAAGEDKAPDVRRAQKPSHLLAGAFVEGRGLLGQTVDTAVDVGVVLLVVLVEGVQHLPRFLGGRGVVEVDKLLFAHPTIQDGKISAHFPYVIHFSLPPAISNGPRLRAPRPSESSRAAAPGPIASYSSSYPG